MKNRKFVGITGYGWTGSSALYEKLRDDYSFTYFDYEYSLVWDLDGLLSLFDTLTKSNDLFLDSIRIEKFLKYIHRINSRRNFLNPNALNISEKNGVDVVNQAQELIRNLTLFSYENIDRTTFSNLSPYEVFVFKLGSFFFKKNHKKLIFNDDLDSILSAIRNFQNSIFIGDKPILLDQPACIYRLDDSVKLFSNMKLIAVDRDPRDILADLSKNNALLGVDFNLNRDISKYIDWHKFLRKKPTKDAYIINFESLILDEKRTLLKVDEFINENAKKNEFNLEKSAKNIGIWKKVLTDKESNFIKSKISYEYID